jgi:cytoskeletal protein CcmA (bactofilin family)
MAKKSDLFGTTGVDTVIGSGVRMRGNLTSEGDISIDGRLVGNVKSGGHLTIGVNAQVTGDVSATSVTVGGRLDGNIKAIDTTHILSTGHVYGDIDTGNLEIGLGGVFIGLSKMKPVEATEIADRTQIEE